MHLYYILIFGARAPDWDTHCRDMLSGCYRIMM